MKSLNIRILDKSNITSIKSNFFRNLATLCLRPWSSRRTAKTGQIWRKQMRIWCLLFACKLDPLTKEKFYYRRPTSLLLLTPFFCSVKNYSPWGKNFPKKTEIFWDKKMYLPRAVTFSSFCWGLESDTIKPWAAMRMR